MRITGSIFAFKSLLAIHHLSINPVNDSLVGKMLTAGCFGDWCSADIVRVGVGYHVHTRWLEVLAFLIDLLYYLVSYRYIGK